MDAYSSSSYDDLIGLIHGVLGVLNIDGGTV
jgi:hypothetical protein